MNINFKEVYLKNFGSYAEATIALQNRGFCAVQGRNHFRGDCSLSNGSGKSMLWSAICFALTGETIRGIKTQLKNKFTDETDSYVSLEFTVDMDEYKITRYIAPKSDLTIIKNNIDVSGKGIRESEKKLSELLPDLTKDLIASTIIIGQGMPSKFSSFSPVGRKELLEKLTKSDFMIDAIKQRISERQAELSQQMREYDDNLLISDTKIETSTKALSAKQAELAAFTPINYDLELLTAQTALLEAKQRVSEFEAQIVELQKTIDINTTQVAQFTAEKTAALNKLTEDYNLAKNPLIAKESALETELKLLRAEITKLEAIVDICPTCGRKLDNVIKPDTTGQHTRVAEIQTELATIRAALGDQDIKRMQYTSEINHEFNTTIDGYSSCITTANTKLQQARLNSTAEATTIAGLNNKIFKINFDKENEAKYLAGLKTAINELEQEVAAQTTLNTATRQAKLELQQHVEVIKKIESLVKRDFRGYLLLNIISFLDRKAKEYSEVVYGTRDLEIRLDGNALDITYGAKNFDNLSGGEQQRVDLILQFAIRDMLSTYLNYSSNILVLDEIFDNLDRVATDHILELITTKLKDIESVFIISHHSDSLNIGYDFTINVIKNEDGISEIA